MVLTEQEFQKEFPGEGDHLEFKQGTSWRKIQEAAAAFSNAEGGVILVGVGPDGLVKGLLQPGEKARAVHEALNGVNSLGRYEIHQITVGTEAILAVSVERRHKGFAQTSDGVVRVRGGRATRRFSVRTSRGSSPTGPSRASRARRRDSRRRTLIPTSSTACAGPTTGQTRMSPSAFEKPGSSSPEREARCLRSPAPSSCSAIRQ